MRKLFVLPNAAAVLVLAGSASVASAAEPEFVVDVGGGLYIRYDGARSTQFSQILFRRILAGETSGRSASKLAAASAFVCTGSRERLRAHGSSPTRSCSAN